MQNNGKRRVRLTERAALFIYVFINLHLLRSLYSQQRQGACHDLSRRLGKEQSCILNTFGFSFDLMLEIKLIERLRQIDDVSGNHARLVFFGALFDDLGIFLDQSNYCSALFVIKSRIIYFFAYIAALFKQTVAPCVSVLNVRPRFSFKIEYFIKGKYHIFDSAVV